MSPKTALATIASVALAAFMTLAVASAAAASPGTMRVVDFGAPSLGATVTVKLPGGGSFTDDPGRNLVRITPSGGASADVYAFCVDPTAIINGNTDYPVDLQTPADTPALDTPAYREAAWLMGAADDLIAASPNPSLEAAAVQVAVWQITGGVANVPAVTSRSDLNARVVALRALAAGRRPVTELAVQASAATVTTGTPVTLTVTGTPGAVTDLSVTAGAATLSAPQVTLGSDGSATLTVTPTAAGDVAVRASAQGGALMRAAHLSGRATPQDMAVVTPVTVAATATLAATAPAVVTPGTPPAVQSVPAALGLTKTAPASIRRGRSIHYRLVVRNTSGVAARDVVVRDPVPGGAYVGTLPSRARLVGGAVVWRLGTLAPGAKVTVTLTLRTRATAVGSVVNAAAASASNAATVHAKVTTALTLPTKVKPARVQPAVTG